jgi:predicted RNA binding protein YcfA (HicA-like mRNA interferase family)
MKPVTGKEMCKALERKGWTLARIKGAHYIYEHPDHSRPVPVPVHSNQTLKSGTQRAIMRQGLTDADL